MRTARSMSSCPARCRYSSGASSAAETSSLGKAFHTALGHSCAVELHTSIDVILGSGCPGLHPTEMPKRLPPSCRKPYVGFEPRGQHKLRRWTQRRERLTPDVSDVHRLTRRTLSTMILLDSRMAG